MTQMTPRDQLLQIAKNHAGVKLPLEKYARALHGDPKLKTQSMRGWLENGLGLVTSHLSEARRAELMQAADQLCADRTALKDELGIEFWVPKDSVSAVPVTKVTQASPAADPQIKNRKTVSGQLDFDL